MGQTFLTYKAPPSQSSPDWARARAPARVRVVLLVAVVEAKKLSTLDVGVLVFVLGADTSELLANPTEPVVGLDGAAASTEVRVKM